MLPVKFSEANETLAKDQPQYTPLPVHVGSKEDGFPMTACFELTDEEVAEIIATRKLWYTQTTFGHPFQPVRLSTHNPFEQQVYSASESSPISRLVTALLNDTDYRETWKANIAMAFYDEYIRNWQLPNFDITNTKQIAEVANQAAENFLNLLCAQGGEKSKKVEFKPINNKKENA
jgi:hypothetical protein